MSEFPYIPDRHVSFLNVYDEGRKFESYGIAQNSRMSCHMLAGSDRKYMLVIRPKPKPKPKPQRRGLGEGGHYDSQGYCDNPARGY